MHIRDTLIHDFHVFSLGYLIYSHSKFWSKYRISELRMRTVVNSSPIFAWRWFQ